MGHFYQLIEGVASPFYEVPYADPSKGMRDTTLADARKVGAFPSPNTVNGILASYGLEKWRREQYGECAADVILKAHDPEWLCFEDLKIDIDRLYAERMDAAPSAGTDIHAAIENATCERMGWDIPHPPKDVDPRIVQAAMDWLDEHNVTPVAVEKVFVSSALGYGGKLDLLAEWQPDFLFL